MKDLKTFFKENAKPRDWPEDFDDENGTYTNFCYICRHEFMGMKGRICCRTCNDPNN